jgi:hypothetical protein
MGNKNIVEIGRATRFSSTNQPKNNGRKPKLYTQLKDVYQVSAEEYKRIVQHLLNCSKEEIKTLQEAKDTPIWVVNICSALLTDTKKGVSYILTELTDRLYGKPKQVTENYSEVTEKNKAVIVFTKPKENTEAND